MAGRGRDTQKMHENASSIFAHNKYQLSDGEARFSIHTRCGLVSFHWTMWSMRVVFLLAILYLFSHRMCFPFSEPTLSSLPIPGISRFLPLCVLSAYFACFSALTSDFYSAPFLFHPNAYDILCWWILFAIFAIFTKRTHTHSTHRNLFSQSVHEPLNSVWQAPHIYHIWVSVDIMYQLSISISLSRFLSHFTSVDLRV